MSSLLKKLFPKRKPSVPYVLKEEIVITKTTKHSPSTFLSDWKAPENSPKNGAILNDERGAPYFNPPKRHSSSADFSDADASAFLIFFTSSSINWYRAVI